MKTHLATPVTPRSNIPASKCMDHLGPDVPICEGVTEAYRNPVYPEAARFETSRIYLGRVPANVGMTSSLTNHRAEGDDATFFYVRIKNASACRNGQKKEFRQK
jgi:hypothetical protein